MERSMGLGCTSTRMGVTTTETGNSIEKMEKEFITIIKQEANMMESGERTTSMGMGSILTLIVIITKDHGLKTRNVDRAYLFLIKHRPLIGEDGRIIWRMEKEL